MQFWKKKKNFKMVFQLEHFDTLTTYMMSSGQRFATLAMFGFRETHNKNAAIIVYIPSQVRPYLEASWSSNEVQWLNEMNRF